MKRVIFLIALNCIAFFEGKSQQRFSHIYQAPLLLNPSFAGSTGGARLAAVTNYTKGEGYYLQNNYLSFDHLLNKSGIGLGAAFFTYKLGTTSSDIYHYPDNINTQTIGGTVSIAPKYILKRTDGSKRATLSPSIAVSYIQSDVYNQIRDYSNSSYYTEEIAYSNNRTINNKEIKLSAGLLYNSDKLILGLVISNRFLENDYASYKMVDDSSNRLYTTTDTSGYLLLSQYESRQPNVKLKRSVQNLDFHVSKIIKIGSSKFSVTPTLNLGFSYYHKRVEGTSSFKTYRINAILQVNYGKLFIGGGIDRVDLGIGLNGPYLGFAGFKSDRIKIMGSYSFYTPKVSHFKPPRTFELSVNYTFNSKTR